MSDEAPDIRKTHEFRAFLAKHHHKGVKLGERNWRYLEVCPESKATPLVLIPGTSGTPLYFFRLLSLLEERGVRAIAVDIPVVWSGIEFADAIAELFSIIGVSAGHFLGVSLGGYLALHVTRAHPSLVLSLILCNAFADTECFTRNSLFLAALPSLPQFYLKKYLLEAFPRSTPNAAALAALDFAVLQIDDLTQEDMAARLSINATYDAITKLPRSLCEDMGSKVTILESFDHIVLPAPLRMRLRKLCHSARMVAIEDAGNFPFLTRHEEIAVAVIIHLKNNGVPVRDAPAPSVINGKKAVLFRADDIDSAVCEAPPEGAP